MNKSFLKLAIPNIITNLTVPLVSLVDLSLMGHLGSTSFIIAIGLAVTIFNFIYWSFGFLRMGTTGIISQAYGANNTFKIKNTILQSFAIGLLLSLILILSQNIILKASVYAMNTDPGNINLIKEYFNIRIWDAPATILLYVLMGFFLGMQNSKQVLLVSLIINVSNILLSFLLVRTFNMGIRGAAFGTLLAQYIGLSCSLIIIYKKYAALNFWKFEIKDILNSQLSNLLKVNSDIFIRTLILIACLSLFRFKSGSMEGVLGASNILLLEFVTISAFGIDGFAFAAEAITGKYFGQKNRKLFIDSVRVSFYWGIGISFMFAILFYFFSGFILSMLTNNGDVILKAMEYIPWLIIAPIINAVAFIWDGVYIGSTSTSLMRNTMIISGGIFLFSFYTLPTLYGNHGLWFALTLFMAARGIAQTFLFKSSIMDYFK